VVEPTAGKPAFGTVRVTVEVADDLAIRRLEVWLDGRLTTTLDAAPWSVEIDVGQDNRDRTLEVVAHSADGDAIRDRVSLPAVVIHDRLELDLQQLYVTVTDRAGRQVLGLDRSDFRILDEGVPQEIVTFEGGDIPFSAVLLVDASGSMSGPRLQLALEGVSRFLQALGPQDEVRITVFSDRIERKTPFLRRDDELASSPREAADGTALFDWLWLELRGLEARQGRRVALVLSDGWDGHSVLDAATLARQARRSQTQLYWLRLDVDGLGGGRGAPRSEPARAVLSSWFDDDAFWRRIGDFQDIVRRSGGRAVRVTGTERVGPELQAILEELRNQFAIGYYPEPRHDDGRFRKVQVRVLENGLRARTSEGYVDR
jgi:Ca-activated chloride channel family protein